MNVIEKKISLSDGREIIIETGKLAKQADGSVVVRMGGTMLLATVVCARDAKEGVDFLPLSVEYKEKFSASGKFPGGFLKREGRPGDAEILVCRLVDRALRPLFPADFHADTFVTINLLSAEADIMPDALAGLAASAALSVSDVPFHGPMSEVRVARIDGQFVVNPTFSQLKTADLDIMVAATMDNIMMVEGEMAEVSEADMLEAMKFAHEEIKKHCQIQKELEKEAGKETKREYCHETHDEELKSQMWKDLYDKVYQVAVTPSAKEVRTEAFAKVKEEYLESMSEEDQAEKGALVSRYYHDIEKEAMRNMVLNEKVRLDGRKTDEIRPISCEIDYLPCTHGSALFTRGETQSLTSVTLGTKMDEKIIDEVLLKGTEKFTLHYNFPPFSTNDAKPNRGTGRREIGHGNLAFRALKRMVPAGDVNPYAIRVVSDILESNGSSSMATVCAGSLALMDAGINLKKAVSGIAMGLITDETANKGDFKNGKYAVLSDILGDEDHLGDMDFKVTGTADGITACQMDIKVEGLDYSVLAEALEQAKKGRLHILGIMNEAMSTPRSEMKPHAPRIVSIQIPKDSIGAIIGPGGKIIQEIQAKSGATIALNEKEDTAFAEVFGSNKESIEMAVTRIKQIIAVPEVGEVYKGIVKGIVPYGAFVEILPNKQGLLHISEIEWRHLKDVNEVLKMGEEIEVKLIDVEKGSGHLKLSRKVLLPKPE